MGQIPLKKQCGPDIYIEWGAKGLLPERPFLLLFPLFFSLATRPSPRPPRVEGG